MGDDLNDLDESVLETSAFQTDATVSNAGNAEETVIDSPGDAVIIEVDGGTEIREKKITDIAQEMIVKECEHCQNFHQKSSSVLKKKSLLAGN